MRWPTLRRVVEPALTPASCLAHGQCIARRDRPKRHKRTPCSVRLCAIDTVSWSSTSRGHCKPAPHYRRHAGHSHGNEPAQGRGDVITHGSCSRPPRPSSAPTHRYRRQRRWCAPAEPDTRAQRHAHGSDGAAVHERRHRGAAGGAGARPGGACRRSKVRVEAAHAGPPAAPSYPIPPDTAVTGPAATTPGRQLHQNPTGSHEARRGAAISGAEGCGSSGRCRLQDATRQVLRDEVPAAGRWQRGGDCQVVAGARHQHWSTTACISDPQEANRGAPAANDVQCLGYWPQACCATSVHPCGRDGASPAHGDAASCPGLTGWVCTAFALHRGAARRLAVVSVATGR